jgi:hypothetical protein
LRLGATNCQNLPIALNRYGTTRVVCAGEIGEELAGIAEVQIEITRRQERTIFKSFKPNPPCGLATVFGVLRSSISVAHGK